MRRLTYIMVLGIALMTSHWGCKEDESGTTGEDSTVMTGDPDYDAITTALKDNPANADLYFKRARVSYDIEDYPAAIQDLARALVLDSTNLEYHYLLSDVYLRDFKSQMALNTLERAAAIDPAGTKTQLKLAELQLILRQYDAVYQTLGKVMEKDPQNTDALFLLGMTYDEQGNKTRAIQSFQTVTELESQNSDAWIMLGKLYAREENPLAGQCFDNAIAIDSNNLAAWHAKAFYLQDAGKVSEALDLYNTMHALNSQYPEAYLNAGILYLEIDSTEKARNEFHILSKVDPSNPLSYYYLGVIAESRGEISKALHQYNQAYRLSPDFQRAKSAITRLKEEGQGEM